MLADTFHAINESGLAIAIRESATAYPLLQVLHIIGFALFAGGMIFANLRVAGVGANVPLTDFVRYCTRVALVGLVLVVFAGVAMFISFADVFFVNTVMRYKLLLVLVAIGNLVILMRGSAGESPRWLVAAPDPARARGWAGLAIALFIALVTLGKLLAYIGGKD